MVLKTNKQTKKRERPIRKTVDFQLPWKLDLQLLCPRSAPGQMSEQQWRREWPEFSASGEHLQMASAGPCICSRTPGSPRWSDTVGWSAETFVPGAEPRSHWASPPDSHCPRCSIFLALWRGPGTLPNSACTACHRSVQTYHLVTSLHFPEALGKILQIKQESSSKLARSRKPKTSTYLKNNCF